MCSINHDMKAIFIHIHKTGGTYISYILHKHYGFKNYYLHRPDHDIFCMNKKKTTKYLNYENRVHGVYMYYKTSPYINKKMGMTPQKWDTYYKFCFVRNPYDRIISGWYHVNKLNQSFTNYLSMSNKCNDVEFIHVFMSQVRNIINEKGNINHINFIGRFENLEEDLHKVLKNIGFNQIIHQSKNMNKRDHHPFYTYYNQLALSKVNYILREDFNYLGFKSFNNINDFFDEFINKNDYQKIEDIQNIEVNNNLINDNYLTNNNLINDNLNNDNLTNDNLNNDNLTNDNLNNDNLTNDNITNKNLDSNNNEEENNNKEENNNEIYIKEDNDFKEDDNFKEDDIDFISELLKSNIKI